MATPPTLSFASGDAEWTRLRKESLRDLYFFNAFVLGYGERVPMHEHTHRLLCRFVDGRTGEPVVEGQQCHAPANRI